MRRLRRGVGLGLGVALLLSGSGCAWTIRGIEQGSPLRREDFRKVRVDQDTLGDVLARLGPPDDLVYSPWQEVLVYRQGRFRGTDLTLTAIFENLPGFGYVAGLFRTVFGLAGGNAPDLAAFRPQDPVQVFLPAVISAASFAAAGSFSNERVLELRDRRIRYRAIRITLDRKTGRVLEKSFRDPVTGETSLVRSTFLRP